MSNDKNQSKNEFSQYDELTSEWLEAWQDTLTYEGLPVAEQALGAVVGHAQSCGADRLGLLTPPVNTIAPEDQPPLPEDLAVVTRLSNHIRWNAIAMVARANRKASELGGHMSTYASSAALYDVGYQWFFRSPTVDHPGDIVYFQGHASPGMYARAFMEGRFSTEQLDHFRQEAFTDGLSSYPHPHLMPDFWQFPTVSMGLGPISAVYQAHFNRYLENRNLVPATDSKVWCFGGDGEMDEPESRTALSLAAREKLDNLIYVINCNLQSLDGPVRGSGSIVNELEGVFRGAGWRVIKLLWNSAWDRLFAQDRQGKLAKALANCVDGELQNHAFYGAPYLREHFFGSDPDLAAMVADWSDEQLSELGRGGHDFRKIYAAYSEAAKTTGRPTVVLVMTVKGSSLGKAGEAANTAHNTKKLSAEQLQYVAKTLNIDLSPEAAGEGQYVKLPDEDPAMRHLRSAREALGGDYPKRRRESSTTLTIPPLSKFKALLEGSGERQISTTMAYVRIMGMLLKDKDIGSYLVPIVPDECRTFGMEGLFKQVGIYTPSGPQFKPVDNGQIAPYREAKDGQLILESLTEAGSMAMWTAAGISYSNMDRPMIPFYIYYSMFGFQRVGDQIWAAADAGCRGFLIGATAGRTTLAGEGLQHQDGHSHIAASTVPGCVAYDPTFGYEVAVLIHHGIERMYGRGDDVFFYLTVMNENYAHPPMPEGAEEGIIRGLYRFATYGDQGRNRKLRLLGCGTILNEVIKAAEALVEHHDCAVEVYSATSFNELYHDMVAVERYNRLHPESEAQKTYVETCLAGSDAPVVAATDYMRVYADRIRPVVNADYHVLGTDGFGRSDTRAALREFFEVNANHVIYTSLYALYRQGKVSAKDLKAAQKRWQIDPDREAPF